MPVVPKESELHISSYHAYHATIHHQDVGLIQEHFLIANLLLVLTGTWSLDKDLSIKIIYLNILQQHPVLGLLVDYEVLQRDQEVRLQVVQEVHGVFQHVLPLQQRVEALAEDPPGLLLLPHQGPGGEPRQGAVAHQHQGQAGPVTLGQS